MSPGHVSTRTNVYPDTCLPGQMSTRTKMPGHVLPGHIFPGQLGLHQYFTLSSALKTNSPSGSDYLSWILLRFYKYMKPKILKQVGQLQSHTPTTMSMVEFQMI